MKFEWDEEKNRINIVKHGFDFADAWEIFECPMLTAQDYRVDYGEDRWVGIGIFRDRIMVIVFTEPEENTIRVISVRKATKHERKAYEKIF
jgi:uncharacterized DUF497 family protein